MRLRIPYHSQKTDYLCGPAVLQMVFSYFKKFKPQDKLAKDLKTSRKTGTHHREMIRVARENGFHCLAKENSSLHEIKHFIDKKLPVIVYYLEPDTEEDHIAIVSGYSEKSLIFHDPWNGKDFRLSNSVFLNRWHDHFEGKAYRRWMMVISKKDFNLGKKYPSARAPAD